MFLDKEVCAETAIDINGTDAVIAHHQGSTHDRANAINHNTLLGLEGIVLFSIVGEQWFAGGNYAPHGATTDGSRVEGTFGDGMRLFIAGHRKLQFPGLAIY